jgi:methanethiol S-methyltransferase
MPWPGLGDERGDLVAGLVEVFRSIRSGQMAGAFSVLYGMGAYGLFLVTTLYAMGFVGNLVVPKTIDSGAAGPVLQSVIIDGLLLGLFAVQHSVMARQGFKQWWTRVVPRPVERSTFVLFASLVLLLLFWQWRPIPDPVWTVRGPVTAMILTAIFWGGWLMLLASTFMISHFELLGLSQVFAHLLGREPAAPAFRAPMLYRHVRHPIYLSFLVAFWATPSMTVGHLLFAVATTAYVLIAIQLEERDLIRLFGDQYRRYRASVAMLVPMPRRPANDDGPREEPRMDNIYPL